LFSGAVFQDIAELAAAQACERVSRTNRIAQQPTALLQQLGANGVAAGVVGLRLACPCLSRSNTVDSSTSTSSPLCVNSWEGTSPARPWRSGVALAGQPGQPASQGSLTCSGRPVASIECSHGQGRLVHRPQAFARQFKRLLLCAPTSDVLDRTTQGLAAGFSTHPP